MTLASCHPSGAKGFEKASRFLENLCTRPVWKPHLLLLPLSPHSRTAFAIVRENCNQSIFRTLVSWVAARLFRVRILFIVFWGQKSSTRGKVSSYIGLRLPREGFRTANHWRYCCLGCDFVSYLISTCVLEETAEPISLPWRWQQQIYTKRVVATAVRTSNLQCGSEWLSKTCAVPLGWLALFVSCGSSGASSNTLRIWLKLEIVCCCLNAATCPSPALLARERVERQVKTKPLPETDFPTQVVRQEGSHFHCVRWRLLRSAFRKAHSFAISS
jgi:hypothetical protein